MNVEERPSNRNWAFISGCFAVAVALLVILGWVTGSSALTRVIPGLVSMNPLTAVCFLLSGAATVLLARPLQNADWHVKTLMRGIGRLTGLLVAVIGILVLCGYFADFPPIDKYLFAAKLSGDFVDLDNRMSVNTALCFVLTGCAILTLDSGQPTSKGRLSDMLLALTSIVSLVSLVGYLFGLQMLSGGFEGYVPMALHTAITFLVLSMGLISYGSAGIAGVLRESPSARLVVGRMLPLVFIAEAAIGWLSELLRQSGVIDPGVESAFLMIFSLTCFWCIAWWTASLLSRLEAERRSFFDLPLGLFCVVATNGEILRINRELSQVLGIDVEKRRGTSLLQISHKETRPEMVDMIERAHAGTTVRNKLVKMTLQDGTRRTRWLLWSAHPVAEANVIYAAARDVTDLRKTQLDLEEARSNLDATLESISDSVILVDTDGCLILMNGHAEALTGWVLSEASGLEISKLLAIRSVDDDSVLELPVDQIVKERKLITLGENLLLLGKNNAAGIPVEIRLSPVLTLKDTNKLDGVVITMRDVTEQRRVSQALIRSSNDARRAQSELRAFIDNVPDAVIGANDRGVVKTFNFAAETLFGWKELEVVGRNILSLIDENARDHFEQAIAETDVREGGQHEPIRPVESSAIRRDGSTIPVEVSLGSARIDGTIMRAAVIRDLTKRLEFIRQIDDARREAERANMAKSEFLAMMSHEIRTPMNGVIGMVDLLHRTSLRGDQVEMTDVIRDSAHSLLEIINGILDFSKIESGKMEVETTPCSLEEIIDDVSALFDRVAEKSDVELVTFADPLLASPVMADRAHLRQVFTNLLSNAIKFSSKENPDVAARVVLTAEVMQPTTASGDNTGLRVSFKVTDNGIGMDAQTVSNLFQPFVQANSSTRRRYGGTGLGLTICGQLVKMMGGEVRVDSEVGVGSTFSFTLDLDLAPDTNHRVADAANVANLNCIVVGEKHAEGISSYLAAYLDHGGARVSTAGSLTDAMEQQGDGEGGVCLLIVDAMEPWRREEQWADLERAIDGSVAPAVAVVTERGQRRTPRRKGPQVITVDGNSLTRRRFLNAVALAAGRSPSEEGDASDIDRGKSIRAPTYEDAVAQGRLILVAEDNATNQLVIRKQLALLGYACDIAEDGRDALEKVTSGKYWLLLTDLHMPTMDGYELTSKIRSLETDVGRMPVIALTANALPGEEEICRNAGMDGYLSKPVELDTLSNVLQGFLPSFSEGPDASAALPPTKQATRGGDPSHSEPAPMTVDTLEQLVGDDPVTIADILNDYLEDATKTASEVEKHWEKRDTKAIGELGHKLKSSSRSVGASKLGDICAALETAGRDDCVEAIADLVADLHAELELVASFIKGRQ